MMHRSGNLVGVDGVVDHTVEGEAPPPFNKILWRRYGSRSARCIY